MADRRALLDENPRAKAVLDLAAEKAGWGQPLPKGVGRGVSVGLLAAGAHPVSTAVIRMEADGRVSVLVGR